MAGTTARKEIKKPDEFVSIVSRFLDFYDENKTPFWVVVIAIVVVSLGTWGYFYTSNKKFVKYQYLIGKQVDAFNKWEQSDNHDTKELAKIKDELQPLVDEAPAKLHYLGMYYLARILFEQNKFDTAISVLENIKNDIKDDVLKVIVYSNLYKMYATKHNYKKALDTIEYALDNFEVNPYEKNMIIDKKRYKQYILWTDKTQSPKLQEKLKELQKKLKLKPSNKPVQVPVNK